MLQKNNIETVLEKVFDYEKSIPRIDDEIAEDIIKDNIYGRWKNLKEWFLGQQRVRK